jgi:hypothetical protein
MKKMNELGIPLATIEPPVGASDAELLPQMFVRVGN